MAGFYTRIVRRSALRAFCFVYENHSAWRLLYLDWRSLFIMAPDMSVCCARYRQS